MATAAVLFDQACVQAFNEKAKKKPIATGCHLLAFMFRGRIRSVEKKAV
jgi:hypothetical protein